MKKKFFNQRTITLMIGILLLLIGMHFVWYQAKDKPGPYEPVPGKVIQQWESDMYFSSVYSSGSHTKHNPRNVQVVLNENKTNPRINLISVYADFPFDNYTFLIEHGGCFKTGNHLTTTVLAFDNKTSETIVGDIALDLEAGYLILQLDESDRLVVASTDSTVAPEKILNHFYSFVEFHCPDWLTVAS